MENIGDAEREAVEVFEEESEVSEAKRGEENGTN